MKIISIILVTFICTSSTTVKSQNFETIEKREVYNTIVLIGKAWTQNNLDTLNKYIDANYIHNDVRGQKLNRTAWLNYIKDRKEKGLTNPDIEFEDIQISAYGDIAIVTGINTFTGEAYTSNDIATNKPRKLRFAQVLKKENDIWKRIVFQATYIDVP